jgi:Holin of 3TMs, for gene-transfer release
MGMMEALRELATAVPPKDSARKASPNRFDQLLDAINRLPRPLMALGTLALFADAMFDPVGFAARMAALEDIPEPLWWLMGGIITFYFGARETHYLRKGGTGAEGPDNKPDNKADNKA